MRAFEDLNPMVIAIYYVTVALILMLSQNPILLLLSFFGAILYSAVKSGRRHGRTYLFYLLLFCVLTLINPLLSHNGVTVLFVMGDAPVTLEATVYGACSAGMIVTVLLLFLSFTEIMTRDKLLYVFSKLSPKLALVLSMGLRYVPLFGERAKRIRDSQRAVGLYREDNLFDKIKGDVRVFSILVTWALENGITTADSMAARGYGRRKRTHYSHFRMRVPDTVLLLVILICAAVTLCGMALGAQAFVFYPSLALCDLTPMGVLSYTAYGTLCFLPIFTEMEERVKWSFLRSKI